MSIAAVDLFCGVGGLTAGLLQSGIEVKAGIDLDAACRWSYQHNNGVPFIEADVERLSPALIRNAFGKAEIRVLAGCAPCQPFSSYGRTRQKDDVRWRLLEAFASIAGEVRPHLVTMENVPGVAAHPAFARFVSALRSEGFDVVWTVVRCEHYGVPQRRRRLVLVASRIGPALLPDHEPGPQLTVRETIGHLPPISAGARFPGDCLHVAASLGPLNLRRIRRSVPGGSWRDWPKELRSACHLRGRGRSYTPVYGRMAWDEPSPTITTQFYNYGSGRFGHPEQDRAISLREGALLQSFPRNWEFVEPGKPVHLATVARAIGNAVPPALARGLGRSLIKTALAESRESDHTRRVHETETA